MTIKNNNIFIESFSIDNNGYLKNEFGMNNKINENKTQFISKSFDIKWKPMKNAISYVLVIEDFDATKVIGFPFIHWVVCNINTTELKINQSFDDFVKWDKNKEYDNNIIWQGYNSSIKKTLFSTNGIGGIIPQSFITKNDNEAILYFGCCPPDKDHMYTLTIYGLNCKASELYFYDNNQKHSLNKPYYISQLFEAINDKVVDFYSTNFMYKKIVI